MKFQLSPGVDENKVFLADFSELNGRYDPDMVLFRRRVHNFRYPVERMHKFFSHSPQYGANEKGIERETKTEPRYVRITDINEYGLLNDELGASAERIEPQYVLEENDLLFARSGNTVGKSYIHKTKHVPYPCFFAGYLIRLRFDQTRVLPEYIFALTQLPNYKGWVKAIQRASGQPNINAQEYANLDICIAPMPVQIQIVKRLEEAYAEKKHKDAQAKAQLAGIDALLLSELGITPAPALPNTIENRIFIRHFSEVTGERFDPIANQPRKLHIETSLQNGKYPTQSLRSLVTMPKRIVDSIESGEIYIGLENIDGLTGEFVSSQEKESVGTAFSFSKNQILFPKLRPYLNKTHLARFDGLCSTEFHVLVASGIQVEFLTEILRSSWMVGLASLLMTGTTLPRLQTNDIERFHIPVPPPEIQEAICQQIKRMRTDAKQLFLSAQSELDGAKAAIEAMILGRD